MAKALSTKCPKCQKALTPVALDPQSAPWVCNRCHLGFFVSELADSARAIFRPRHQDWGQGTPASAVRLDADAELDLAEARGTSLREDQIKKASTESLQSLVALCGVSPEFLILVQGELTTRGIS